MKKGDIVKIKNKCDIDIDIAGGPGWDYIMDKYCGEEYKVKYIEEWITLEDIKNLDHEKRYIENYVWHIDWLINENDMHMFEEKEFEL